MSQDHSDISPTFVPASTPGRRERPLDPVRKFLNTLRIEEGVDRLEGAREAGEWLREQGYGTVELSESQRRGYVRARELIRAAIAGEAGAAEGLNQLVRTRARVRPAFARGAGRIVGGITADEVDPGYRPLQAIVAALWRGAASGELARLKVCADSRCRLAFYDQSRNLSRIWCTAGECGNRNRVARHRARRRRDVHRDEHG